MQSVIKIVSVSGGKDSTALYLWAIREFGPAGFRAIFADTGHEHPVTYNYIRNLPAMANGPEIEWVRADFSAQLEKKQVAPSGNPFLDMMLWKGRAPSTKAQFCTEHLKLRPIAKWLDDIRGDNEVEVFVGIRSGESERRRLMPAREFMPLFDCYRSLPLKDWSEDEVFAFLKENGVAPNPLYGVTGISRVGCFPCIHARKSELMALPEWAWKKLEEWEARLGRTWFPFGLVPLSSDQRVQLKSLEEWEDILTYSDESDNRPKTKRQLTKESQAKIQRWKGDNSPTISLVREWCRTERGGSQFPLFSSDDKDVPSCMSTWGICE